MHREIKAKAVRRIEVGDIVVDENGNDLRVMAVKKAMIKGFIHLEFNETNWAEEHPDTIVQVR